MGGNEVNLAAHQLPALHIPDDRPRHLDDLVLILMRGNARSGIVPALVVTEARPAQSC